MNRKHILTFVFAVGIIVLSVYFQNQLIHFKSLGLLGIFLINFLGNATIFLPAPAIATVVLGGVVYSPLIVAVVSSLGGSLGEMVGYALGYSGRKLFIKNHHILFIVARDIFKDYGTVIVLAVALIPLNTSVEITGTARITSLAPILFKYF